MDRLDQSGEELEVYRLDKIDVKVYRIRNRGLEFGGGGGKGMNRGEKEILLKNSQVL